MTTRRHLSHVSMEDPVERIGDWQDLFTRHSVADVRKIFKSLDSRKRDHGEKVREIVGQNHVQIVELTARIAAAKGTALKDERQLTHLCSTKHDTEWKTYIDNLDKFNQRSYELCSRQTARQLAVRLLGFASECWLNKRYSAAARSLYFVSNLCDDEDIRSRVQADRAKLAKVVGDWLNIGINEGMSQELFNTCLIIHAVSPKKMVVDFFQRRQDHIESIIEGATGEKLLHVLDLVGSTLFVANQLTDHVFKTRLSTSRLISSPEFNEADLRIKDLSSQFDQRLLSLPCFPQDCYLPEASIDITAARSRFIENIAKILRTSAGPIASTLDISDISSLYTGLILKIRDSAELLELGDVLGDAFHAVLVKQFETKALERFGVIKNIEVKLPVDVEASLPRLEFTKSTKTLLTNLSSLVKGQIGPATEPLDFIEKWADSCAQVSTEVQKLQQAANLHRDQSHRDRLYAFIETLNKSIEKVKLESFSAGISKLDALTSKASSPYDFAMLAMLKQYLDRKGTTLNLTSNNDLNSKLDKLLVQALVDSWTIKGDKALLEGLTMPSSVLNGLYELSTTMDSLLPEFEWHESTLEALRPLVVAKVKGYDETAAESVADLLSGTGELASRFRCILAPLVPSEREHGL